MHLFFVTTEAGIHLLMFLFHIYCLELDCQLEEIKV